MLIAVRKKGNFLVITLAFDGGWVWTQW